MTGKEEPPPVHAYVFGKLTQDEREALATQALNDPDVLDDLWDAIPHHEALQNPAFRKRLRSMLLSREKVSHWSIAWLSHLRPAPRFAMLAVALTVAAALVWQGFHRSNFLGVARTATVGNGSTAYLNQLFGLPKLNGLDIGFAILQPRDTYRIGQIIHAEVTLKQPSAVFVLRRVDEGTPTIVFPSDLSSSPVLPAGRTTLVFDSFNPTAIIQSRKRISVLVVATPPGTDIRVSPMNQQTYSLLETGYDVLP